MVNAPGAITPQPQFVNQPQGAGAPNVRPDISFDAVLDKAMHTQPKEATAQVPINPMATLPIKPTLTNQESALFAQAITQEETERVRRRRRNQEQLNPEDINESALKANKLDITPFQLFMDRVVELLEGVSQMEFKVNDLTQKYIRGEASIDEVSIETAKLNLSVSFVTTVVTQAKDTFKELIAMQV